MSTTQDTFRAIASQARERASAVSAIRELSRSTLTSEVLLEIAAHRQASVLADLHAQLGQLAEVRAEQMPFPVLASIGGGHREVQWTQYIAHVLRFGGTRGRNSGGPLAEALVSSILGTAVQPESIVVRDEVALGRSANRDRYIDLLLEAGDYYIGIEHKTVSGSSDGGDGESEEPTEQATAYLGLLQKRFGEPPRTRAIYLAPQRRTYKGWQGMTHCQLSEIMAPSLRSDRLDRIQRMSAAICLLDMIVNFGGGLRNCHAALGACPS